MAIADFIVKLKAILKAGDEKTLLNEYCHYPAALAPNDLELRKTMSALFFTRLYGKS